jgi:hypothetical protein
MSKILLIRECSALCPHYLRHNLLLEGMRHGVTQLACLRLKGENLYDGTFLRGSIDSGDRGVNKQQRFEEARYVGCFLKAYGKDNKDK